jgi:hypothetical protein
MSMVTCNLGCRGRLRFGVVGFVKGSIDLNV